MAPAKRNFWPLQSIAKQTGPAEALGLTLLVVGASTETELEVACAT
jgi:hypothetical protein